MVRILALGEEANARPIPASWLIYLLVGMTTLMAVCSLSKTFLILPFDGDVTYPESAVARISLWAADSGHLYPSLQDSPYTPAPYGPLLYLTLATLARLGRLTFWQLMIVGRVLSFLAFGLLALLVYRWCRRCGLQPVLAALGVTCLLAQIDFMEWNVGVRSDMFALLLVVTAFYVISMKEFPKNSGLFASGLCLGSAVLFKQSYVAAAMAIGLWLLSHRRFRALSFLIASSVLPVLVTIGFLLSRHEPVLQEMLAFRSTMVSFSSALVLLKNDFLQYPPQCVFLSLALLGLWNHWTEDPERGRLLGLYFALAWLIGIYTSAAPGASVNAFLEPWAVCCLLIPFGVNALHREWSSDRPALNLTVLLFLLSSLGMGLFAWQREIALGRPKGFAPLASALKDREFLSDNSFLAAQAKTPELLDPSVNHYMELAGRWSSKPIVDKIAAQHYDAIILGLSDGHLRQWRGYTLFSSPILRKVQEEYEVSCFFNGLAVLLARDDPRHAREEILSSLQRAGCQSTNIAKGVATIFGPPAR